jgi:phosphoribosylaminoimidazole carboxylase PurE protein
VLNKMPGPKKLSTTRIGIILGSASDISVIQNSVSVLNELYIQFEVAIASAHRTPDDVANYAKKAKKRGIEVIIAVAGLSAALPGVVAATTPLPVIGVPVKGGALDGLDALLSIAQMPPGVPVATVGLNSVKNACLLAARIIAVHDKSLSRRLTTWSSKQSLKVVTSREKLSDLPVAPEDAYK